MPVDADRRAPPAGFPWLVIAGKALTGWVVIDMDATLVTAYDLHLAHVPDRQTAC